MNTTSIPTGSPAAKATDADTLVLTAPQMKLYGCRACGQVSELAHRVPASVLLQCPRCDAPLDHRRAKSIERTWAYLIAAMVLYLPANFLNIMSTTSVFGENQHTILGGIEDLWVAGDWSLAIIVFVASIAVPMLKIAALLLLVITAQRGSRWRSLERSQLYRMVEAVGHWSMLDVYVVVLLVGTIRFGALGGVAPGPGLLAFAAVVVLTMLAASSFDPRLIWPEEQEESPSP